MRKKQKVVKGWIWIYKTGDKPDVVLYKPTKKVRETALKMNVKIYPCFITYLTYKYYEIHHRHL